MGAAFHRVVDRAQHVLGIVVEETRDALRIERRDIDAHRRMHLRRHTCAGIRARAARGRNDGPPARKALMVSSRFINALFGNSASEG